MSLFKVCGLIFLLVGLLFIFIGYTFRSMSIKKLKSCTQKAWATVVELKSDSRTYSSSIGRRHIQVYRPVLEYLVNDECLRVLYSFGSNHNSYALGDTASICYNVNSTRDFYVVGDKRPTSLSSFSLFFGVLILLIGVACIVFS